MPLLPKVNDTDTFHPSEYPSQQNTRTRLLGCFCYSRQSSKGTSGDLMTTTEAIVPYYVKGVALGVPIFLTAIQLWTWLLFMPGMVRTGTVDFRQAYAAAYMLRSGRRTALYSYAAQEKMQTQVVMPATTPLPYVAPAYEAFLLQPFSYLTFRNAYLSFVLLNAAALVACFLALR